MTSSGCKRRGSRRASITRSCGSTAKAMSEPASVTQTGSGIFAQANNGGTATVNVTGFTAAQVKDLLDTGKQSQIDELSRNLDVSKDALRGFFSILRASDVPLEKLPQTLSEIAQRHLD